MSDMKTVTSSKSKGKNAARAVAATRRAFTVRDMNRQPAALLKACDALGAITIRSRNGHTYRLVSEGARPLDSGVAEETIARRTAALERMRRYHDAVDAIAAPRAKWTRPQIARINAIIAGDT